MKTLLSVLLSALFFLASCKKDDVVQSEIIQPSESFTIDGIHDLNFSRLRGATMVLSVGHVAANQESVALSVADLPDGISARFSVESGIPDFRTRLTFRADRNDVAAGTYVVKVIGTSASSSRSYALRLVVPGLNEFWINLERFAVGNVTRTSGAHAQIEFASSSPLGAKLVCTTKEALPAADGVYTYYLDDDLTASNNMRLLCHRANTFFDYEIDRSTNLAATVRITNGKAFIKIPKVSLRGTTFLGGTVFVSADMYESDDGPVLINEESTEHPIAVQ